MGHFSAICRSAKTVDTVVKNGHSDVAFIGEMAQSDQPWLAKVDLEAVETRTLTDIKFKLDTRADVTVISEEDYKTVGRPKLCESTTTLLGANQTVLKPSGKCCGRLSQGDAMLEEDIYLLGSQKRSLLGRRACETLGLIKRMSVDTMESAEIYKRDHPKLFDGLGKIPGQYEIKLCSDFQPFIITTPRRVSILLLEIVRNSCRINKRT